MCPPLCCHVSGTLWGAWTPSGLDTLGVRSASDRVGSGLPRRPPLRSPAPRWVGRGWASGDRGTRVWRRLGQGWPGRRTRPCSPCTAHCQAGPLHRQRRCWGRRGPPCPSRGDVKVAVAVATRPAARESGRTGQRVLCSRAPAVPIDPATRAANRCPFSTPHGIRPTLAAQLRPGEDAEPAPPWASREALPRDFRVPGPPCHSGDLPVPGAPVTVRLCPAACRSSSPGGGGRAGP